MRRKIQNISLFSSITKYMPALHSRLHQTLAHVNSTLNWQFKWVTQTECDTQNSVRSHCISYSLLYRNQKYILKIHIRAIEVFSCFVLEAYLCGFTTKEFFVCYFADLLKQSVVFSYECSSCSTRLCLGGQECHRFLGKHRAD